MKIEFLSVAAVVSLSACGGSTANQFVELLTAEEAIGPSTVALSSAGGGANILVDSDEGTILVPVDDLGAQGTFQAAFESNSDEYGIAYLSEGAASRAGVAIVAFNGGEIDEVQSHGGFYNRTAASTMPTTGEATFDGDYASYLVIASNGQSANFIAVTGTLSLTADFEALTVSGGVTDRIILDTDGYDELIGSDVADLTFDNGTLDDTGAFSGTTSGGGFVIDADASITAAGTFEGLVAGEGAVEAVGAVSVAHTFAGNDLVEVGVFAAGH